MKRRVAKLVLFMLFGAIANVSIAWGLASAAKDLPYTKISEAD